MQAAKAKLLSQVPEEKLMRLIEHLQVPIQNVATIPFAQLDDEVSLPPSSPPSFSRSLFLSSSASSLSSLTFSLLL